MVSGAAPTIDRATIGAHWSDQLEQLLFAGESVVESARLHGSSNGRLLVTTHRVILFAPTADGPPLQTVSRPNVLGIDRTTHGGEFARRLALRAGLFGALLLVVGVFFDPAAYFSLPTLSGGAGVGAVMSTIEGLLALLLLIDEAALSLGLGLLVGGVVAGGYSLVARKRQLVIAVAGDQDLTAPGRLSDGARTALLAAIDPTRNAQSD